MTSGHSWDVDYKDRPLVSVGHQLKAGEVLLEASFALSTPKKILSAALNICAVRGQIHMALLRGDYRRL